MEIVISVAMSADGYIDDASKQRLMLSNSEDWQQVYALRAECDAILVGAQTVRSDNPSLNTKSQPLRDLRLSRGLSADPKKITVTRSCDIDPLSRIFTSSESETIVVTDLEHKALADSKFGAVAKIVAIDGEITAAKIVDALALQGIKKLMVEGGAEMIRLFLDSGYVDRMRVAVAPFFVGDSEGVRFMPQGVERFTKESRMELLSVEKVGDMSVSIYDTRSEDRRALKRTIELGALCPKSDTAYSVGAMIVTRSGEVFEGFSRKSAPINHAEEEAIMAAQAAGVELEGATIYSSMEPCSQRSSKPRSCSSLIIEHGFAKVVFAVAEPENFVRCTGRRMLEDAGLEVVVMTDLADDALKPNSHIMYNC